MNGIDMVIITEAVLTVYTIIKWLLVKITGCDCELELSDIVEESNGRIAIYRGSKGKLQLEVTHACIGHNTPNSVKVIVDRIGNSYTYAQYFFITTRVVVFLTVFGVLVAVKYIVLYKIL